MLKLSYALVMLLMLALLAIGCSGGRADPLTSPANSEIPGVGLENEAAANTPSDHMLWGIWEFHFDHDTLEATANPIRNAQAHFNITDMLLPPACNDCLKIKVNSFDTVTRILDADVTLRNPTQISGYDVRGILYTNDYGHELLNADDWTKLWDVPGGPTLNPFKAFAKTVYHRQFAAGAEHTEKYLIYIPQPPQWDKITFAVDASWPGNCKEPYEITNFWQEPLYDIGGSTANIYVDVHDWQGDVDKVTVVAPEITGEQFTQLAHQGGDTWEVDLYNNAGAQSGNYGIRIIGTSSDSGLLALYDYAVITITQGQGVFEWARTWGGISADYGNGVATEGSGNIYVTGHFYGTVFLRKFDSSGNFKWALTWAGSSHEGGLRVTTDSNGNIYVTGFFRGTVDFDPGPGEDWHTSNGVSHDIFLSKFDSSGNFQWACTWGGSYEDEGWGVATDSSGNIYVTGEFRGTVDFDPGPGEDWHTSNGVSFDVFLSKFDSSGDYKWARTWGGIKIDYGLGVVIDGSGNISVTGFFEGTVDFDPGSGEDWHASNGGRDSFLSLFDSTGNFKWARTWGESSSSDTGRSVAPDSSGNLYVTGPFYGTVDFDPGPGEDWHTSNGDNYMDVFLSKFDSTGNFKWARTWGGMGGDEGLGVATDSYGNIYVTGFFRGTVDFDPGPGEDWHTSNGDSYKDVFLSKFDSSGNFKWALTWGGSSQDEGLGVTTDTSGNIYVTGKFQGTVNFNPNGGEEWHTSSNYTDIFLSKFAPDGNW